MAIKIISLKRCIFFSLFLATQISNITEKNMWNVRKATIDYEIYTFNLDSLSAKHTITYERIFCFHNIF